jgi:hypothetical protein
MFSPGNGGHFERASVLRLHHGGTAAGAVDDSRRHQRQIGVSVNLAGQKRHVVQIRDVTTDKGNKDLMLRINILPPRPCPK